MAKLLSEVAYCKEMSQRCYAYGDYASGEYYENEIGNMTEAAEKANVINAAQGMKLRHYGRL